MEENKSDKIEIDDECIETLQKQSKKKGSKGKEREILSEGQGSWLSHLRLDDEIVWRIQDPVPLWLERDGSKVMTDGTMILPSDTDWRMDIEEIKNRNWEKAEQYKSEMEQVQRDDEKLRKEAAKRRNIK